jgi:hypothetical protein
MTISSLKLPPRYESARADLEKRLPPVRLPGGETVGG